MSFKEFKSNEGFFQADREFFQVDEIGSCDDGAGAK